MDTRQNDKNEPLGNQFEKEEETGLWHARPKAPPDIDVEEDPINQAAQHHFGIPYLFPYQRLVISNILEAAGFFESDLENIDPLPRRQIVILPTGAGKSLCFMLPGVLLPHLTLLIFPLLSLMSDQLRRLEEQGIPAAMLSGGQSSRKRSEIWYRVQNGQVKFLLSNPETLVQQHNLERLQTLSFDHVVIDEAHTLPDWGYQFREALLRIPEIIDTCQPKMLSAFTATASDKIESQLQELFSGAGRQRREPGPVDHGNPGCNLSGPTVDQHTPQPMHVIRANPDRTNISYHVIESLCKFHDLRVLLDPGYRFVLPRPALVFCATRIQAQRCAFQLRRWLSGGEIYFYHAGLEREEKKQVEEWFFHSNDGILCATTAYGMGVDKKNIRSVIHFNVSRSVEAFFQESGRGGRDTQPAFSVALYDAYDTISARNSQDTRYIRLLEALSQSRYCVRDSLMQVMGCKPVACSGCDICLKSRPYCPNGLPEILDFFLVYPSRFKTKSASEILSGSPTPKTLKNGYCHMYGFGNLTSWSEEEIQSAIMCAVKMGILKQPRSGPWRGCIRPSYGLRLCQSILKTPHLRKNLQH